MILNHLAIVEVISKHWRFKMFRIRVGINKFWDFEENCATSIDDERIYTKSGLEAANVAEFIKDTYEDIKIKVEEIDD